MKKKKICMHLVDQTVSIYHKTALISRKYNLIPFRAWLYRWFEFLMEPKSPWIEVFVEILTSNFSGLF